MEVVLGVRADYLGHCTRYPELVGAIERPVVVTPMTRDDLLRVIRGPARLAGLTLEEGLAELLLEDLYSDRDLPMPSECCHCCRTCCARRGRTGTRRRARCEQRERGRRPIAVRSFWPDGRRGSHCGHRPQTLPVVTAARATAHARVVVIRRAGMNASGVK
ncbi:hypothetical protein [Microbispora triticiradicis]|uniref:nSTAND1 domain-containing NTPase n=1 Tax=Microbispora triticiradicis TaxID=2200763 RepID=UPI003A5992FA